MSKFTKSKLTKVLNTLVTSGKTTIKNEVITNSESKVTIKAGKGKQVKLLEYFNMLKSKGLKFKDFKDLNSYLKKIKAEVSKQEATLIEVEDIPKAIEVIKDLTEKVNDLDIADGDIEDNEVMEDDDDDFDLFEEEGDLIEPQTVTEVEEEIEEASVEGEPSEEVKAVNWDTIEYDSEQYPTIEKARDIQEIINELLERDIHSKDTLYNMELEDEIASFKKKYNDIAPDGKVLEFFKNDVKESTDEDWGEYATLLPSDVLTSKESKLALLKNLNDAIFAIDSLDEMESKLKSVIDAPVVEEEPTEDGGEEAPADEEVVEETPEASVTANKKTREELVREWDVLINKAKNRKSKRLSPEKLQKKVEELEKLKEKDLYNYDQGLGEWKNPEASVTAGDEDISEDTLIKTMFKILNKVNSLSDGREELRKQEDEFRKVMQDSLEMEDILKHGENLLKVEDKIASISKEISEALDEYNVVQNAVIKKVGLQKYKKDIHPKVKLFANPTSPEASVTALKTVEIPLEDKFNLPNILRQDPNSFQVFFDHDLDWNKYLTINEKWLDDNITEDQKDVVRKQPMEHFAISEDPNVLINKHLFDKDVVDFDLDSFTKDLMETEFKDAESMQIKASTEDLRRKEIKASLDKARERKASKKVKASTPKRKIKATLTLKSKKKRSKINKIQATTIIGDALEELYNDAKTKVNSLDESIQVDIIKLVAFLIEQIRDINFHEFTIDSIMHLPNFKEKLSGLLLDYVAEGYLQGISIPNNSTTSLDELDQELEKGRELLEQQPELNDLPWEDFDQLVSKK